jgi:hypothetical protein
VVCALNAPLVADHITPADATSFVTVAANASDCPSVNPPRFGVSVTLIGAPVGVTVIVAVPAFVLSATEVAVSVTVADDGTLTGAVYVTAAPDALVVGATVPHVAPLQPVPDTVQLTPLFCESFVTVAAKFAVAPTVTLAVVGKIATPIAGAAVVTVIPAAARFVGSVTDVAVSITSAGVGAAAGAV